MTRSYLGFSAIMLAFSAVLCSGATRDNIDHAIETAQKFLVGQQNSAGTWEQVHGPATRAANSAGANPRQWGVRTCLALQALTASGQDVRSVHLKRAADFVFSEKISTLYAAGLSPQACPPVQWKLFDHAFVKRDAMLLLSGLRQPPMRDIDNPAVWPPGTGFYSDGEADAHEDRILSCTAVGGMAALAESGAEVPEFYWKIVNTAWKKAQLPDGGWAPTSADPQSTFAMTAAAVSTLLTAEDHISDRVWSDCNGAVHNASVDRGMKWLDEHFTSVPDDPATLCWIYNLAHATGRRYLGGKNWREVGINALLQRQKPDGSFPGPDGAVVSTSFALLFLAEADRPIMMNKLRYTSGQPGDATGDAWNERPEDVRNLATWAAREMCNYDFNWQVVDLGSSARELIDVPILYISGSQSFEFNKDEQDRLRAYIEQGGVVLGNANCGKEAFRTSFMAMGTKLFPNYKFHSASPDDLLFHRMFRGFRPLPNVLQLDNGVRKLMLLIPSSDVGRSWQMDSFGTNETAFGLAANLYVCVTGLLHSDGDGAARIIPIDPAIHATRSLKLARLMVGDNPDPEPVGWIRVAAALHNSQKIDLQIDKVNADGLAGHGVAHLTGTGILMLRLEQREAIRDFVKQGGILIVDAAGGNAEFADSVETELTAIFPNQKLEMLPADAPTYASLHPEIDGRPWRIYALDKVDDFHKPSLRVMKFGDRIGVYFSREDLSGGLVGYPADGIIGYTPKAAMGLMSSMLVDAANHTEEAARH